ncbi:unnamed protein product [Adineta steineri]|uniref:Uncharacterized protein n=1 Tax=Adineta steineri TaxID=433720 RepID=A0A815LC51_9BILA|nr:unnamed protein product [Adineta steineri]CAF1614324.1 unnamed protein product [Adineta steineri]
MTDSDSLMIISDDEDNSRLYIDENVVDSWNNQQLQTKSTNTGNAFELDFFLIAYFNRYQTRSSQTVLTSNTNLLLKRHRSTFCQAEYFATMTQETNTMNEHEERIAVVKKQKTYNEDLILSSTN